MLQKTTFYLILKGNTLFNKNEWRSRDISVLYTNVTTLTQRLRPSVDIRDLRVVEVGVSCCWWNFSIGDFF